MRGLLVMVLAGCFDRTSLPLDEGGGVLIDPDGTLGGRCKSDAACAGGDVCARTGACLPPGEVHAVHAIWTLSGQPASEATCSATPDLAIAFYTAGNDDASLTYAPVPCRQGKFTIDKLPTLFVRVTLSAARGQDQTAMIDPVTGDAVIDLPF